MPKTPKSLERRASNQAAADRPDLRRDRRRRRPQRPGQRRLPREGRAARRWSSSAATSSAARRSPRSCGPGFWFTTFSYALSLLRPDIIHELELVKHGFMPLLMPSTFAPDGGRRLPAARPGPRREPQGDRPPLASTTPTPTTSTTTTWTRSARRSSRCSTRRRRTSSATTPRSCSRSPRSASRFRRLDKKVAPRRGPAADRQRRRLPRRLLRVGHPQGLPRLVGDHRHQGRAVLAGLRARAALPLDRRARRRVRGVGVPQGRQRRLHPGARAGGASRSARRSGSSRRSTTSSPTNGRATGVALDGRHRVPRPDRGLARSTRGGRSSSSSTRASCRPTSSRRSSASGSRARRPRSTSPSTALPRYPALGGRERPVPRLHQHRPVDGVPRARLRRREVRLVLAAAVHRLRDPVDDRPGHGAARQARDVVLRPVRAVQAARERLGHRAAEPGRHGPGARSSRSSRASATSSCSARS